MKVLLIGPHSRKEDAERSFMAPALGVIRLAGYLNAKGHEAEAFDPNLPMLTGAGESFEEALAKKEWDFIGFSVLEETLLKDFQNMYTARRQCPKATLIAGGIEAQFNYQTVLDKSPCEYVILSEGETALLDLVNGMPVHKIKGIVFKSNALPLSQELFNEATATINWEDNPYEEYWDYYLSKYNNKATAENIQEICTVRVFSRNRCPIGCKFCSSTNQITWGADAAVPVISATEDMLIHTIKRIMNAHPRVKTIYLTDDDFCINRRSVIRFCQKVVEEDFGDLSFMCFARASDLTDDMCAWMKKANFRRLNVGIESFSGKVLEEMNKRCDPVKNHAGLAMLKRHHIKAFTNIILTTPGTTLDDIQVTLDGAMQYVDDPNYHVGVTLAVKPLKGTEFNEQHCNFLSAVEPVEGTRYHIRRDDIVLCDDPQAREFQLRYWYTIDDAISEEIDRSDIRHAVASNLSLFKLRYAAFLVEEIRGRAGKPTALRDYQMLGLDEFGEKLEKMPYHERQTIDIPETTGGITHPSSSGGNKSVHGSF
ncbi:MAG: hypothetical protein CFH10_01811 [Alphaproteobacteria bacterium MarineAlpha4_Bin2]|nr:MAG: hypothetical protein CFH10_01811 [Alphaproteobacteria bacterium MarineAlpha4_Bin2]